MEKISLRTKRREEFIDITSSIEAIVEKQNVSSGICLVFCPHTTAALTLNENADRDVRQDILRYLGSHIPHQENYAHTEGNSDAHIKSSLLGNSLSLIIDRGKSQLGAWQGIYFCEFDGPRSREVYVEICKKT